MNDSLKNDLLTPTEKVILNLTEGKFLDVSELQTQSRYIGIVEALVQGQHGVTTNLTCGMPGFPIVSNNLQGYEEALRLAAQKLPLTTKFVVKRDYVSEVVA